QLAAPRGELVGAPRALLGDALGLCPRARDPSVELLGLAALEADLALAEPDPVVELVDVLLHAHQPALLDRQLGALGHHVRVLGAPRRARRVELAARLAEPAGDELVLAGELEPAMRRLPQLDVAQLGLVLAIALGLLGLAAQRPHPLVELADDVG